MSSPAKFWQQVLSRTWPTNRAGPSTDVSARRMSRGRVFREKFHENFVETGPIRPENPNSMNPLIIALLFRPFIGHSAIISLSSNFLSVHRTYCIQSAHRHIDNSMRCELFTNFVSILIYYYDVPYYFVLYNIVSS